MFKKKNISQKVYLDIYDDTTVYFALDVIDYLNHQNLDVILLKRPFSNASPRQLALLPRKPRSLFTCFPLMRSRVFITNRPPPKIYFWLIKIFYAKKMIGFQGGVEQNLFSFISNRAYFDNIFVALKPDHFFLRGLTNLGFFKLSEGHPKFTFNKKKLTTEINLNKIDTVIFYTQAIAPFELKDRVKLMHFVIKFCQSCDAKLIIKLRSLNVENMMHKHKEMHSYDKILELFDYPAKITVDTIYPDKDGQIGVTFTSTIFFELLSKGMPVIALGDWSLSDPLTVCFKNSTSDCGLVLNYDEVNWTNKRLFLNDRWVERMLVDKTTFSKNIAEAIFE